MDRIRKFGNPRARWAQASWQGRRERGRGEQVTSGKRRAPRREDVAHLVKLEHTEFAMTVRSVTVHTHPRFPVLTEGLHMTLNKLLQDKSKLLFVWEISVTTIDTLLIWVSPCQLGQDTPGRR